MLILPKPAEDEHALGYIGRLSHINLKKSLFEMMRALLVELRLASEQGAYVKALALTAGMNSDLFVQLHTLQPLILDGSREYQGRVGRRGTGDKGNLLNLLKKRAYFCLKCAEEQRRELGHSYWCRIHQLPGVFWCPRHHMELLSTGSHCMATKLPSSQIASHRLSQRYEGQSIVHRYGEILMDLLRSERQTPPSELAPRLREKAKVVRLGIEKKSNATPYLSDLVFQRYPNWWLNLEFGEDRKVMGQYFAPIDDSLRGEVNGARNYALASSLLFEQPD